jgi:hypothetical protein
LSCTAGTMHSMYTPSDNFNARAGSARDRRAPTIAAALAVAARYVAAGKWTFPTVVGTGCDRSSRRVAEEPLSVEAKAMHPPTEVKSTVAIDVPDAVCSDIFKPIRRAVSIGNATKLPPIPTRLPTVPAIVPMANAPPVVLMQEKEDRMNVKKCEVDRNDLNETDLLTIRCGVGALEHSLVE